MLERLEQSNLFVIALDHTRQWYRYHHLFADALRLTLQHQYPEDIASFHQRASVWYEQNGWMSDAIEHVLKAEDYERTADLLEAVWPEMNDQYQTAAWKHWAFQLPEHLLHQSPLLCSNLGWSTLMAGQLEPSQRWFSRAERWLQSSESEQLSMRVSQPDLFAQLPITLNVAGAYKSLFLGDFDATLDYTGAALAAVTDEEDKALHHLQATSMAGIALWGRGDLLEAEQVMSELVARQHAMNRTSYAIELTFLVADIRLARGQSRAACHAFDTAFLWLKERGEPLLMGLEDLHRGVADLYCLWDRLEEAEEHLYKAEELEKQLVQRPNWKQRVTLSWVFLQTARGELDKALNLLQQAREHSLQAPLPEPEPLDAHEVRLWIRQGRLDEAEQWVQQQQLSVEMELTFLNTFKALTFARLLLARGRQQRSNENFAACHLLCERVRATSQKRGHFYRVMEAELLLALVCHETGEGLQAREHLQKSLALAEPEGIIQLYAQEGATLHTLLSQKPALEISDVFLQRLLKKSGSSATTAPSLSSVSPVSSTLPEPLTERELDVLRWLQTELTGPEIAKEMFVSLSTVRTHTRNLYSKLNTSNRRAAVNRAKELGIL
jgi:LuxR family maltose regulon positive regulatory protein